MSANRRPAAVTVVIVLLYAAAVFDIVIGIVAVFLRYAIPEAEAEPRLLVSLTGAAMILMGLVTVGFASGLSRGSRFSQRAVGVLLVLGMVLDAVLLILDPRDWTSLVVQLVVCAVVLPILFAGRGGRFFAATPSGGAQG